jgi:tetratricopeptide (TPR) repeat protein
MWVTSGSSVAHSLHRLGSGCVVVSFLIGQVLNYTDKDHISNVSGKTKSGVNVMNCSTTSEKPRHRRTALADRATRLTNTAVLVVLLIVVQPGQAQTGNSSDINLSRLAEAVKAISQGHLSKAESLLNFVLASSPSDADALNLLGVVRAHEQKTAEAERLFRRALAASETHIGAHVNLGELLQTMNRPSEALPILQIAHRLAPERADVSLNLARLYSDSSDHRRALEYLQLVPRSAITDDYFAVFLRTLLGLNRLEEARQLAGEFKGLNHSTPEARAEFAMLLAKGGLSDEALDLLEAARRQTPASFPVLYGLGVINAARKQYDKAEEHLSGALRTKPADVTTLRALANVARATGNLEKSLAHLVQARRIAPDAPGVLYDFGITSLQMDLLLDALPVFEHLHRAYPRQPAYLYALAAVRWRKGETVETARLMRSYVAMQPGDASGLYLLGAALLRQDLFTEAQAALQRSLSLKPDPDTEYLLGMSLEKAGNRVAAIETFRRVVSAHADHAAAHAALGAAYREAGSYIEARAALERAIELDFNDLRASYQLGLVYAKLGEKEAAKKMFARADDLRSRQRNQESVILKLIEPPQN